MSASTPATAPAVAVHLLSARDADLATAERVAAELGEPWRATSAPLTGPSPVPAPRIRLHGQLPNDWWVASAFDSTGAAHTIDLVRTRDLAPDVAARVIAQAITDRLLWFAGR